MNQKRLLLFASIGLLLAFIAGLVVGSSLSFRELNSIKVQISDLKNQTTNLSLENEKLKLSIERLNRTLSLLNKVLQNKTGGAEGLLLKVEVKDTISVGEVVKVNLTLTNLGTRTATLTFPSSKIFDFKVLDSSGKVVYRWSWDKVFLTVIMNVVLNPGESKSSTLPWKCELPEGEYTIVGIVEAYNATITCSKSIKVVHSTKA
jgi:regulator of replication initiation timing